MRESSIPDFSFREKELWRGLFILTLSWLALMVLLDYDIAGHAGRDSYTLMALAWRKGRVSLGQDYPWLELAVYRGDWYVSFPSVPALVMWLETFLFGEHTPNTLTVAAYFAGSYALGYRLARRWLRPRDARFWALFLTLGCNMLDLSLRGDVWNQAQLLSFFLMTAAAVGLTDPVAPAAWGAGLACLALAVGCRPFQAVYVPFGLVALYRNLRRRGGATPGRTIVSMLPYLTAPALVAVALGWYNMIRFGNPLEFGHNYLPEFTRDPNQPQLALKYIPGNVRSLLRLPEWTGHHLEFSRFDGFAFYLANPIYACCAVRIVLNLRRRAFDALDACLLGGFAAEIFLLLMHRTFGGWQFGARYLCDLIPMMLLFELRRRGRTAEWERVIGWLAIAFNLYGTVAFHLLDKGFYAL